MVAVTFGSGYVELHRTRFIGRNKYEAVDVDGESNLVKWSKRVRAGEPKLPLASQALSRDLLANRKICPLPATLRPPPPASPSSTHRDHPVMATTGIAAQPGAPAVTVHQQSSPTTTDPSHLPDPNSREAPIPRRCWLHRLNLVSQSFNARISNTITIPTSRLSSRSTNHTTRRAMAATIIRTEPRRARRPPRINGASGPPTSTMTATAIRTSARRWTMTTHGLRHSSRP